MTDARGITHAEGLEGWLLDTLEETIGQLRALLDPSGVAFEVVDLERGEIRPAAAWFASEDARRAFAPLLARPYDRRRPGVTEAAVERGAALLIERVEEWAGATALRERLADRLDAERARRAWDWYRGASFISCPVRTAGGRTLGVLAISAHPPRAAFGCEDLRGVEVFARLAALALERSELLERESRRALEEQELNRALQAVTASLEPEAVYRAVVDQAAALAGAPKAMLRRFDPAARELRCVASRGFSERVTRVAARLDEGMIGRVATTGEPYVSREEDREAFVQWVIESECIGSFVHVPVALGGRLFGVLSTAHAAPGHFGADELRRLSGLAMGAAGAIANALDFQRERRIVGALTRGFVPETPEPLTGFEVGLVYEPAGHDVGGGDLFGVWTLPSGALAVLLGDVSGKGLEVAALSAMVRFFVEARAWDTERPAEVLAQANRILRRRLRGGGFATAFLGVVEGSALRYCIAGHPPPRLLRSGGGEVELHGSGMPLGIEDKARYDEQELAFEPGDTLFAATDGLTEARRAGELFGDVRLPALLAQHARGLPPQRLAELLYAEADRWAAPVQDDMVVLVVRRAPRVEVRREPAHGTAARALFAEYIALVRERLGPDFEPEEAIFATERAFEEPGAAFLVLYENGRPVACGGVRPLGRGLAEIKRMFVTEGARGRGHGRRLLAELEALAAAGGASRVRLLTTEALLEARTLYAAAGYREVEAHVVDGRRDAWLERAL